MKADGFSLDDKRQPIEDNDITDIIDRFEHIDNESERKRTEQSFLVPKQEIVDNGYDLSINKYKEIEYIPVEYPPTSEILANIKALNELGGTLKYVGYYDEAEANLLKSLEIIKKKYGDNNLPYATSLLNLTEVYRFAQKFNLLEENYKKIVKIYQDNSADNSFSYAGLCNNFGLYYQNVGNMKAAYDLHLKSLDISIRKFFLTNFP